MQTNRPMRVIVDLPNGQKISAINQAWLNWDIERHVRLTQEILGIYMEGLSQQVGENMESA